MNKLKAYSHRDERTTEKDQRRNGKHQRKFTGDAHSTLAVAHIYLHCIHLFFLKKKIIGHMSICGDTGDVSSGFQSQSRFCLIQLSRGIHDICFLRFTSGAIPLPVYNVNIAASHLPHMHISAQVRCRDLNW